MSHSKKRSRPTKQDRSKQDRSKNLKLWGGLAVLAVLVAVGGFLILRQASNAPDGSGSVGNSTNNYPLTVTPGEAAARRDSGAFILDVRTSAEWQDGHIPGATLIPLAELQNRLNELPRDKPIVVVCHSGNRSGQARDLLRNAGFLQVTSMAGGMNEWQAQGLPTVKGQA